jgi:iron complex outermembrane receptor protein
VTHELLVGVDYTSDAMDADALVDFAAPIDIFDPEFGQPRLGLNLPDARARDVRSYGAFVQDRLRFADDRVVLLLGLRYDDADLEFDGEGPLAPQDVEYQQDELSPRAGIVVQAAPYVALYGSHTESFENSDPESGFLNAGEFPEPELAEQQELGARVDLGDNLYGTVSAFSITKENVVTEDPDDPTRLVQIGEQESQGVEVELSGELLPGLRLLLSGAYTDTEVTRDTTGRLGNRLPNVPEWGAAFAAQYAFAEGGALEGWSVGTALFYRDDRFADIDNDTPLDDYVRVDANVSYRRAGFVASLNARNLFDERYILTRTIPGAPRSVELRLGYALGR